MLSTEQKNAQNHASLRRKIYLFVRYPYGEIIEGCGLFAKVREGYFSWEISQRDNLYYKIYQTTNS